MLACIFVPSPDVVVAEYVGWMVGSRLFFEFLEWWNMAPENEQPSIPWRLRDENNLLVGAYVHVSVCPSPSLSLLCVYMATLSMVLDSLDELQSFAFSPTNLVR